MALADRFGGEEEGVALVDAVGGFAVDCSGHFEGVRRILKGFCGREEARKGSVESVEDRGPVEMEVEGYVQKTERIGQSMRKRRSQPTLSFFSGSSFDKLQCSYANNHSKRVKEISRPSRVGEKRSMTTEKERIDGPWKKIGGKFE